MSNRNSYREKIFSNYFGVLGKHEGRKDLVDTQKEYAYRVGLYELNYGGILPESKKSNLLELGCGPGFFLKYLADKGYGAAKGVDWSEQEVQRAGEIGISSAVAGDIHQYIKQSPELFDMIFMLHVLEHMYKDEVLDILENIHQRLSPKGSLVVEVPNVGSPLFSGQARYGEFTHEVGFTPSSLKEVLMVTGFRDIRIMPIRVTSPLARLFFAFLNSAFQKRFSIKTYFESAIIGIGRK